MSLTRPSYREIAERFGISIDAVKQWRKRHSNMPKFGSPMADFEAWYADEIAPHENSKVSVTERSTPTPDPFLRIEREAKADLAQSRARKLRLEAEISEGLQVPKVVFERAIASLVTQYRQRRQDQCEAWPVIFEGKNEHYIRQFMRDQMDKEDAHWQAQMRIEFNGAFKSASNDRPKNNKSRAQSRRHARA